MAYSESVWRQKGATLSDKNAFKEYGLTYEELVEGVEAGKLHYQVAYAHGNPYYKVVRQEVEDFIADKHGVNHLKKMETSAQLKKVTTELRSLKRKIKKLEKEQKELEEKLKSYS